MTAHICALFLCSCIATAFGDALLVENFDYADGELKETSSSTWDVVVDAGNPDLNVESGSLVWDFTPPQADPRNNGWYGIVASASSISADSIFAQFDLTVDEAPAVGGPSANIFASFWNGGSGNRGRVWMGQGVDSEGAPVADFFRIGLTKSSGSSSAVLWSDNIAEGTTVQVVVEYDFTNETASLYLDPSDESDVLLTDDSGSSFGLTGFAFRHKDDGDLGIFKVDHLAISREFGDVSLPPLEAPTGVEATAVPGERVFVLWDDQLDGQSTGYVVERSTDRVNYSEVSTRDDDVNYFVDEDVSVGTEYCYRILALGATNSEPSSIACATPFADQVVEVELGSEISEVDGMRVLRLQSSRYASYRIAESEDLQEWNQRVPLGGIEETIEVPLEDGVASTFYRINGISYHVPENVGLTEPFKMPSNGGRNTIDASTFGLTSGDSSDDDAVAIRAAIASAQAGDTVMIPAGDYHVRSIVNPKNGVMVIGAGRDSTVLWADAAVLDRIFDIPAGASDITIQSMTLTRLSGTLTHGIEVGSSSGTLVQRIWLKDLRIEGFEQRGIQIRQAKHVKVEDCYLANATNLGGGGFGYGIALNDAGNNNNWVTGCVIGPVIRHGVLVQYEAHNNLIEYNTCIDTTEDAYDFHGEDEYANELRFNLAYWRDSSGWDGTPVGIGLGNTGATHDNSGPFNWIHHNEVYGYYGGLEVILGSHHQYIDGNYFHDNEDSGIALNNSGGDGIQIRGNLLENNGDYGIYADNSNAVNVVNNEIHGHDIGVSITARSAGARVWENDLTGNTVASEVDTSDAIYENNAE